MNPGATDAAPPEVPANERGNGGTDGASDGPVFLPVRRPVDPKRSPGNGSSTSRRSPVGQSGALPSTRQDAILEVLKQVPYAWVLPCLAEGSIEQLDRTVVEVQRTMNVPAVLGVGNGGTGIETPRLFKEVGPLWASPTPVQSVPSRHDIVNLVHSLWSGDVHTLEGLPVEPDHATAEGDTARVVAMGYGEPGVVGEVGYEVRSTLGIHPDRFFQSFAAVEDMTGARFTLLVELSMQQLNAAYPGITGDTRFRDYLERVEREQARAEGATPAQAQRAPSSPQHASKEASR